MLNNCMEAIVLFVIRNIVMFVLGGSLAIFAFCTPACMFIYWVLIVTLFVTGIMYLKKRGYEFETEETEA